jgi:hypothetical protein
MAQPKILALAACLFSLFEIVLLKNISIKPEKYVNTNRRRIHRIY